MSQETKFVVWDWNGTLLEDVDHSLECFNMTLAGSGKTPIDRERYLETYDVPIRKLYLENGFEASETAHITGKAQRFFLDRYDRGLSDIGFRHGAREVVQKLFERKVEQIILSNHLVPSIEGHLSALVARHFFAAVLAHENSDAQQSWAPKGERIVAYISQNSLSARNGIIIGDTPEEMDIARQSGLISVAVTGGFASETRLIKAAPDYLIHHMDELVPILVERGFLS